MSTAPFGDAKDLVLKEKAMSTAKTNAVIFRKRHHPEKIYAGRKNFIPEPVLPELFL
jgi:hypothetical protein